MMIGDSLNTFCCILLFPSWMKITNLYLVFTVHGHFTKRFKNKRLGPFGHDHNLMRKGTLLLSLCKCRHSDLETQIDLPKVIKLCSRQSPEPRLLDILILASLFPRLKISMTVLINTPKVKERKKRKEKKRKDGRKNSEIQYPSISFGFNCNFILSSYKNVFLIHPTKIIPN